MTWRTAARLRRRIQRVGTDSNHCSKLAGVRLDPRLVQTPLATRLEKTADQGPNARKEEEEAERTRIELMCLINERCEAN